MILLVKVFYAFVFVFFSSHIICRHEDSNGVVGIVKSEKPINGIRIAWDYATLKLLSPASANYSGYARMIKLHDGSLFCVYESDKATYAIKSFDDGKRWSDPMIIAAPENNIACAVPEVLQLQDKSIMVSYNLRPPGNNVDPVKRFSIQVIRSMDGGETWTKPVEVYKAGFEFRNGCWEPAQINFPPGNPVVYCTRDPIRKATTGDTMFRSLDQGSTWSKGEKISFEAVIAMACRTVVVAKQSRQIVAIEDNGIRGKELNPRLLYEQADVGTMPQYKL